MFENIKQGITTKHPAIVEFAKAALTKDWFKGSEHVDRAAHVTFILEAMTVAMCNNHNFFVEAQEHLRSKERLYGLDSRHIFGAFRRVLSVTHNLFQVLKIMSVDPLMIYFRIKRGLNKSQLDKRNLNYLEYKLLCSTNKKGWGHILELLRINIYEAGITEYEKGFKTNSICAFELNEDITRNPPLAEFKKESVLPDNATDKFYRSVVSKNNLFPTFAVSQQWASLYVTWNMAFILSDLDELDLLFPKLLIPSLINAKSENAGGVRIISLWLSINNFFFRKCDRTRNVQGPKHKEEMARVWAKINKKYAFDLAKRKTHEDSKELMAHYGRVFSRPVYHLFKLLISFFR
ncbi:MAG: hypothetical protein WC924_03200 [Candidatus Gracilibacteria bacterium]